MITGIETFREWFADYSEQYTIIGGTACDIIMTNAGLDFRATRDIDMVLIIESLTPEFGNRFWQFINYAGYAHRNKSTGESEFYRFSKPTEPNYPYMIELFSRLPDSISLPAESVLTPLPIDEEISSLSAILLNDAYYHFIRSGRRVLHNIAILEAQYLIPLKAKAYLDLMHRRNQGETIDSKNIKKHKNDVFRLSMLLTADTQVDVEKSIYEDMTHFIDAMTSETVDIKQLGIHGETQESILTRLRNTYSVEPMLV